MRGVGIQGEDFSTFNSLPTGHGAWPKIASEMGGRVAWQCRLHWNDALDPSNNKATKSELAAAAKKAGDDHFAKLEDEPRPGSPG